MLQQWDHSFFPRRETGSSAIWLVGLYPWWVSPRPGPGLGEFARGEFARGEFARTPSARVSPFCQLGVAGNWLGT